MFLLVKGNYALTFQFVCPSVGDEPDQLWADRPASAQHVTNVTSVLSVLEATEVVPPAVLWDFLQPNTLDYGYMFTHDANGEQASQTIDPQYPVMADSNPYARFVLSGGPMSKTPRASNKGNSYSHLGEGQNVLFADMHASFCDRPTVGIGGDNIYTAGYSRPGQDGLPDMPGEAPTVVPGAAGDPPANYRFDIVCRTDALILP